MCTYRPIFVLLFCVLFMRIGAYEIWDCPCQPCWCGSFQGGAEFLWLRAQGCEPSYVLVDDRPANSLALPSGKNRIAETGIKPGFRLAVGYLYEGRRDEFHLSFTGLWAAGDRRAFPPDGGGLWPTLGHPRYLGSRLNSVIGEFGIPAFAYTRARIGYEAVTAEFARRNPMSFRTWIRGAAGVHWTRIRDRLDAVYQGTALLADGVIQEQMHQITYRNEAEGVGPHFGLLGHAILGCGLGIELRTGLAVLLGQRKISMNQESQGVTVFASGVDDFHEHLALHFRSKCVMFPQLEARMGLTYRSCCGRCHAFVFAIGYEWTTYLHAIGNIQFNDTGGTNDMVCNNVNFNGLYLSAQFEI